MLIEFSVTNFRSIRDKQTFTLVASSDKEHQKQAVATHKESELRLLRSAVIYGPNAAGKSNLLRALNTLRQLVQDTARLQEGQKLPVSPFLLDQATAEKPAEFEILFIAVDGVRYQYGCAVTADRVHKEWMVAYPLERPQRWFERAYDEDSQTYDWWFGPNFTGEAAQRKVWQDFTRSNALFFSTAIQLNNDQLKPAFNWITQRLIVLSPGVSMNPFLSLQLLNDSSGAERLMSYLRAGDVGIDRIDAIEREVTPSAVPAGDPSFQIELQIKSLTGGNLPPPKQIQIRAWHKQLGSDKQVPLDIQDESDGTRKLFEFAGGWIRALDTGATLFVDELDRSLHPYITRFLVGLFTSANNRNNAQLVYTTHDTTLLDDDLQRRDQIWFVRKDESQSTKLYSLLEYKPRKGEALERGYLKGRYGALPSIGDIRD